MGKKRVRCPACGSSQCYIRKTDKTVVCVKCGTSTPQAKPVHA